MVHRLEEYNNYILFQNKIADERIKGIEQGMLRISERINELYGVGFPNSFILMLARCSTSTKALIIRMPMDEKCTSVVFCTISSRSLATAKL